MKRFHKILQTYLLCAFPFVLACMIWSQLGGGSGFAWEILSWNLITWFSLLFVFFILLISFPFAREATLKRIANLKERDERESFVTGKAARKTYISTLSLLFFMLFLSTFNFNIIRVPESRAVNGQRGIININISNPLQAAESNSFDTGSEVLFDIKKYVPSKGAFLLLLIFWQLWSFNWNVKKELQD
jgi:hypothetical protein